MATPQNIRYIPYSPHLSIPHHLPTLSPTHPLLSHIFPFHFPHPLFSHLTYFPYSPFFPSPYIHTHSPYLLPISPLLYSHIICYYIVQCPYTPYSPIPIHCPISPHTRPCNLSVLLYTILCTLTYSPPIVPCETYQ